MLQDICKIDEISDLITFITDAHFTYSLHIHVCTSVGGYLFFSKHSIEVSRRSKYEIGKTTEREINKNKTQGVYVPVQVGTVRVDSRR